ncbi:MAG: hypothetical protein HUK20_08000, partial [Fibrobacter sp.]|nr:hypothetical protein [Fibrobacter sp.]
MKRVSTSLAFILGTLVSFTSAAQIQGFVSGYAPGDVDEKKEAKGKETTKKLHADFMWGLGAEFLANPVGPLMVGGGLGFFSVQQDGGEYVVMSSIPVWASLGLIGPEQWSVRPYLEARVGYPIPAATLMTWWDKPYNFFVTGTVGVQLPYHVGVEFDCTYLTMDKYFAKYNVDFRLTSLKIGGSITVHFDLSGKSSEPGETFKKSDFVVQGAVEESSSAEPLVDANEEQPAASEEQTFSDYSSQPAEEPAVQENADIQRK